jgi:hypothetical protein
VEEGEFERLNRLKKQAQIESLRVYVLRVMSNGTQGPWTAHLMYPPRDEYGRFTDFALEA